MKNKFKWLGIVGVVIVIILVILMINGGSSNDSIYVEAVKVEEGNIDSRIYTSGKVYPLTEVKILTEATGTVETVFVEEGDTVTQGQKILKLSSDELENGLRDAQVALEIAQINYNNEAVGRNQYNMVQSQKNLYESAKNDYENNLLLYEMGSISKYNLDASKKMYDEKKSAYESAKNVFNQASNLKVLELQLQNAQNRYDDLKDAVSDLEITSPVNGMVTSLSLKQYDKVAPATLVCLVQSVEDLEIKTSLGEYEVNKIHEGDKVFIKGDGVGDNEYKGTVSNISPSAISSNGGTGATQIPIKIDFDDEKVEFKPYYTAKLEIQYEHQENVLTVPYVALLTDSEKQTHVYRINDDMTISDIQVEVGIQGEINVEIVSDEIKIGDRLVIKPSAELVDGQKITIYGEI